MQCSKCGSENVAEAVICENCGESLQKENLDLEESAQVATEEKEADELCENKDHPLTEKFSLLGKKKTALLAAAAVVLVAVVVLLGTKGIGTRKTDLQPESLLQNEQTDEEGVKPLEIDPMSFAREIEASDYFTSSCPGFKITEISIEDREVEEYDDIAFDSIELLVLAENKEQREVAKISWWVHYTYEGAWERTGFDGSTIYTEPMSMSGIKKEYQELSSYTPFIRLKTDGRENKIVCGNEVSKTYSDRVSGVTSAFHGNLHVFNVDTFDLLKYAFGSIEVVETQKYVMYNQEVFTLTGATSSRIATDGEAVAYKTDKDELYLWSSANKDGELIVSDVGNYQISPDGKTLVYQRGEQLYLYCVGEGEEELPLKADPLCVANDGTVYAQSVMQETEKPDTKLYYIDGSKVAKEVSALWLSNGIERYMTNEARTELLFEEGTGEYFFVKGAEMMEIDLVEMAISAPSVEGHFYNVRSLQGQIYYRAEKFSNSCEYWVEDKRVISVSDDAVVWKSSPYGDVYVKTSGGDFYKIEAISGYSHTIDNDVKAFDCDKEWYYYATDNQLLYAEYSDTTGVADSDPIILAELSGIKNIKAAYGACYVLTDGGDLYVCRIGEGPVCISNETFHELVEKGDTLYVSITNKEISTDFLNIWDLYAVEPDGEIIHLGFTGAKTF